MLGRQQHHGDPFQRRSTCQHVAQGNEIDDVMVFVQRPGHFCFQPIVVSVQTLANVAVVGDEVTGAKDQIVFRDADVIGFGHIAEKKSFQFSVFSFQC